MHSLTTNTDTETVCVVIVLPLSNHEGYVGQVLGSQELRAVNFSFFSWLVIFFFLNSTPRAGPPPRIPCFLAIVSGVVNQLFLWLWASFTLAGFHCSSKIGKEAWESAGAPTGLPGRGQKPIGSLLLLRGHPNWQFESSYSLRKTWHQSQCLFHTVKKKQPYYGFCCCYFCDSHSLLAD